MKITMVDKALRFFGLDPERKEAAPDLHAIAQGLLFTGSKTEAWFSLGTTNTDIADAVELDQELDSIIAAAGSVLEGKDCHLKIVWGQISSDEYLDEADQIYTTGNWQEWAELWADTIERLGLLQRYLMLGVKISDRSHTQTNAKTSRSDALGLDTRRVSRQELLYSLRKAQEIGRPLRNTKWRAQLASPELIAWMTAREMRRENVVAPVDGVVEGDRLARITQGRLVPYTDHLRAYAPDGSVAAYVAVMTLSEMPEEIQVPGEQEWLRGLGTITRNNAGHILPVVADASVRFRILTKTEAAKLVDDTRKVAKEQRASAGAHSAGETSESIEFTEAVMSDLGKRMDRESMILVKSHPRIVVSGSTYEDVMKNAAAVTDYYNGIGIKAIIGQDDQRDLWLETLPGDLVRVSDLGHVQDGAGFFGSFFWGGSKVGAKHGPVIGVQTGTTSGLVKFGAADAAARGDATTTFYGGRSGRGKSTAMLMDLLETVFAGGWAALLDVKGDLTGAARVAKEFGLPHGVIEITPKYAGCADPFAVLAPNQDPPLAVTRQLTLLAPKRFQHIAETVVLGAARKEFDEAEGRGETPSTWNVIQLLRADDREDVRELGDALEDLARTDLGSVIAGRPTGVSALSREPGLWIAQFPNLVLPDGTKPVEDLDASERLALAVMRAFLQYVLSVSSSKELRSMKKSIGVPEVHRLLRMPDGADFLVVCARMGRAFGTHLLLDSQDVTGVAAHEGLVEQLTAVFIYQLTSRRQQDAAAELIQRQPSQELRDLIYSIGIDYSGQDDDTDVTEEEFFGGMEKADREREEIVIRHGHCIYFDWQSRAATMQRLFPSEYVGQLLSTAPDAEIQNERRDQESENAA
ncbi:hypothetical protein M707_23580 [Arthrobacter sp. AK-YN10]|nr:hypothetical protein M707_23580 [Arthrobacter sp. AK-YN10]